MMSYKKPVIVVKNTREFEKINISHLPDNAEIRVLGGLAGKSKYNEPHYAARTTYPLGQLKQIIAVMREVESGINPNWPELAKARYVYETLGKNIVYNFQYQQSGQQSSNLSTILSRKAICAGYSLLFKEMMDRQGIQCDYMRGVVYDSDGYQEKHAWNVLKINGKNIPIDLTWDAHNLQKGKPLQFFGNDRNFSRIHIVDSDEVQYNFSYLSSADLQISDYRNYKNQPEVDKKSKHDTYVNAMRETYLKYAKLESPASSLGRVKRALYKYATEGNSRGFTRQGFARENLEKNVTPDELLDFLVEDYVQKFSKQKNIPNIRRNKKEQYLAAAITETIAAYSPEQAKRAIKAFITENRTSSFTNRGNSRARTTLRRHVTKKDVLSFLLDNTVQKELYHARAVQKHATKRANAISKRFKGKEFELISAPSEPGLFKSVINWINEKTINKNVSKKQSKNQNENSNRTPNKDVYKSVNRSGDRRKNDDPYER